MLTKGGGGGTLQGGGGIGNRVQYRHRRWGNLGSFPAPGKGKGGSGTVMLGHHLKACRMGG